LWSLHNLKKSVQIGTTKQGIATDLSDHTDYRNGNKCS